jgi:hypothetical protein
MIAVIVDLKELWETVVASLVAGVGVTAAFSLVILGAARSAEYRRSDRSIAAGAAGALAALALLATLAALALGMVVMLAK